MSLKVMGIDPGNDGAIATWDGLEMEIEDIPSLKSKGKGYELDVFSVVKIIRRMSKGCDAAYIELPGVRREQSPWAGVKTGITYGILLGIISCLIFSVYKVTAPQWKKKMRLTSDKNYSRTRAIELFPDSHEFFCRKKDHNRAEACLLAEFGRVDLGHDRWPKTKAKVKKRKRLSDVM